jgi:sugar lactone lactonase YvrE
VVTLGFRRFGTRLGARISIAIVAGLLVIAAAGAHRSAAAVRYPDKIVLSGATSAEGIAIGRGTTFFAGDLFAGDIYRGDLRSGEVDRLVDAPEGRMANGMDVDRRGRLLFVAGAFTGEAYVYDTMTGAEVAVYHLGDVVNDVVVTRDAAWFTDSFQAQLYRIPIGPGRTLGEAEILPLSGPAADLTDGFNLNGITATPNGKALLVAHTTNGTIIAVDPRDGTSRTVAGVDVPSADGIRLESGRLFVVQTRLNQVSRIRLSNDLTRGTVEEVITSPLFQSPTTADLHGSHLAVINAKFDTGFPPTADEYEVVIVEAR